MPRSIFSRKRDLVYLIFFTIHLPIIFLVDIYPLYPPSLVPQLLTDLRSFYITTYADQFFVAPPSWFTLYTWLELLYHVPVCLYTIPALLREDPLVPVHLLVYAVQTGITTGTCIADMLGWEMVADAQKWELGKLYGPYLLVSMFMGVDMFLRLSRQVGGEGRELGNGKKAN